MKIYAHRGASGYAPENTMAAYELAFSKYGADGIEIDVHYSKDGQMVIAHDFSLKRNAGLDAFIHEMTYSELQKLDIGSRFSDEFKGEKIPLLSEVLALVKRYGKEINVELKAGSVFYNEIEKRTLEMIYKYDLEDKTIISSFDHYAVMKVKELDPSMKTGVITMSRMVGAAEYVKKLGADAYHPVFIVVTPELADELRRDNIMLNTFTPNSFEDLSRMKELGISIAITNYPDVGLKAAGR